MSPAPTDKVYPVTAMAAIVKSLEADGIASPDALGGIDLSPAELHSPETLVSLSQLLQCYQNAARLSADPYFAYHAGLRFHVSTYGLYGLALLSSTDFRQTARFAEQYQQIAIADADIKFREQGDYAAFLIEPTPLPSVDSTLYRFIVELHFGIGISLIRDIMGSSFMPRELHVTYDGAMNRRLTGIFDCPVLFGRMENALVFDKQWLDGPAKLGNEITYLELIKLCDQLMDEMQLRAGIAGCVREVLLVNFSQPISFEAVARRLKMSKRTLKRRLLEEGTSYRKIVDGLRTQLAIRYLGETKLTIEEIASCLGFGEAASFRQAFRRWTKTTPGEFRRRSAMYRRLGSNKNIGRWISHKAEAT